MLALRQASDIEMAALKNSGPGHRDFGKAAGTLRYSAGRAARVERRQESVTKRFHLRKGVGFTALVNYGKHVTLVDRHLVGFEVPSRIGGSSLRPGKQIGKRGERSQRDVLAKVRARERVERDRIAFVQRHDLGEAWRVSIPLSNRVWRAGQNHAPSA